LRPPSRLIGWTGRSWTLNVPNVFSEYAERLEEGGWYIELDGWQDIFHLEASYHASVATLTVAVRIPLLRRESRGYDLYKPTFFPIMHGSQLYDIRTDERIFAWEKATASYLNLYDEALNRCIRAGNKYYCNEDKVVMQGSPQTCLAAVWLQHWDSIKLMCHLWSRPAILSAPKINSTHTVVKAPETTEVRVQCKDSPKLVKNIRGQWWLAMGTGCRASTSSWEIVSKDKEAVEDETVVISVHTNVTAWMGEAFNFTLETPAPLQSVTSDIVQALRESESGPPVMMLVTIGVAATAVVVVASFLIITYVKFKKFSATCSISGDSEATVA
jgi:hypothetical protein